VTWQEEYSKEPLWIYGIDDHLKQVFLNIIMNAIEAMQPGGGKITVSTDCDIDNNEASVSIADTGPGINPNDVEKLFEPFYTTKEGGSGLGLSICYEIVQQHAGRITIDSQPGKGATFTVWLPANPEKNS
jgi:signal transduction histidine kinase